MPPRCINIDWLEVYAMESPQGFPHDAYYFSSHFYSVRERDYGTRQYKEMFTILDEHDEPFLEIRRNPVSGGAGKRVRGIFSEYSCHIKLSNNYCYRDDAIDIFAGFLYKHGYTVQRLYRLDLCLDFERFDDNTDPDDFIKRYLNGVYSKINQGNISAHGVDRWEGRAWNSLSWGAPTSMVSTKLYNKTIELKQAKDKPYIRFAWFCAGLIDDFQAMTKQGEDGKPYSPQIWRLEFSIKSSAKGWAIIQNNHTKHTTQEQIEHCLDTYDTKAKQMTAFAQLCYHYFYFVYYEDGKRKDLCKPRQLFKFKGEQHTYTLSRLLTTRPQDRTAIALAHRIERFKQMHLESDVRKACDIILKALKTEDIRNLSPSYDLTEFKLLQLVLQRRLFNPQEPIEQAFEVVRSMMELPDQIF